MPENSPWSGKRQHLDFRPKHGLQILCERLGDEGHVVFPGGRAEELRGDDQIAHFPEFDGQKSWFGGRWRHCGQTNVLDIKPSRLSWSRKRIHFGILSNTRCRSADGKGTETAGHKLGTGYQRRLGHAAVQTDTKSNQSDK